jgi:starch synthase
MQGLMAERAADIRGILNGIETHEWNPATDLYLAAQYDASHLAAKSQVKQALQHKFFLSEQIEAPLLGVVSRLTFQKGLDMLLEVAQPLLDQGCQIVILGSGEPALENGFRALAYANPDQVSTTIGYNESLSHQIMAGVDMFIMPSRFEPCGLNQMYGMRYGTPPIVTNTGGLADSVIDTDPVSLKNKQATGFVMPDKTPQGLLSTVERALGYYRTPKQWKRIQQNGMRRDLSWKESALQYVETYISLLQK